MMPKNKVVTSFFRRYTELGFNPDGFNKWVDGVLNDALNKVENKGDSE